MHLIYKAKITEKNKYSGRKEIASLNVYVPPEIHVEILTSQR